VTHSGGAPHLINTLKTGAEMGASVVRARAAMLRRAARAAAPVVLPPGAARAGGLAAGGGRAARGGQSPPWVVVVDNRGCVAAPRLAATNSKALTLTLTLINANSSFRMGLDNFMSAQFIQFIPTVNS